MEETVSFCGRVLTASELNLVRQIIADFPRLSQAELAYTICELMEWRRPNGKLKNSECVEWLQKWQQKPLPGLPELRVTKPRGAHRLLAADPQTDPQPPLRGRLADYQPLRLQLIEDLAGRRLFQQYMQRYHPLGYRFSLRRATALPGTHSVSGRAGLPAVHQCRLEDGAAR